MRGTGWLSRRAVLSGMTRCGAAMLLAGARSGRAAPMEQANPTVTAASSRWHSIVVGAGAFGTWTAWNLHRMGRRVLLIDAWGPAHSRASSGGESRVTRAAYGADEVYTRMAWSSLDEWRWLSERAGLPVFHETGVLFFFPRVEPYVTQTLEVHGRLKLPTEQLGRAELARRFPQIDWTGVEIGLHEPKFGALMARRAVQGLCAELVKAGGEYRTVACAAAEAATDAATTSAPAGRFDGIRTASGDVLGADTYVFACGPWLPKVFPRTLGGRIFPTRQEVFYFAPEPGDARFQPGRMPTWADFNDGDIYYGMPDLEARGFKIAHDRHGELFDPDLGDRMPSAAALADVRGFMRRRFPVLASRPLTEARVCQYENSSNGDLLIDRHPQWENVFLVGAGSGHGFKHAPAVGHYASQLVTGQLAQPEPRFSLASKGVVQRRLVH